MSPATTSATNITFCAPILSESFPSLGAAIIFASPEAENANPANNAT